MGVYLNPGNELFREALNGPVYVDKTEMVADVNALVNTPHKYLCVSRPRRFGKSMAAVMLCAYYGMADGSREHFEKLKLAQCPEWDRYLGKFDVIRLVMTNFVDRTTPMAKVVGKISMRILDELHETYPDVRYDEDDFVYSLSKFYRSSGRQFVVVIDEWDVIFRTHKNDYDAQRDYLNFLRSWLKDQDYVALSYMTGILPVKKYGEHSALNMYSEFSMVSPLQFAPYTGFTEEEVKELCDKFGRPFNEIKDWYDGYLVEGAIPPDPDRLGLKPPQYHLYAPLSVVNAMTYGQIKNYWNATETYEALAEYIRMDFDGLKETVARLMEGEHLPVRLGTYQNDMTSMTCRDDVLALLIHLGYLGYDQSKGEVFIPNHDQTGNRTYNSEAALSYAVQLAFYKAQDDYTLFPEVDTGRGYADLIYIPKRPIHPALLVELKYNQNADTALEQILRQKYPSRLEHYKGNLILVGISYDRSADPAAPNFKHHSCKMLHA